MFVSLLIILFFLLYDNYSLKIIKTSISNISERMQIH
jgi:hypothetical protein